MQQPKESIARPVAPSHPGLVITREEIPLSKEEGKEVIKKRLGRQVSDMLAI